MLLLLETEKKIVISAKLVSMYIRGCQHHIIFSYLDNGFVSAQELH
jgi:hypothetical protein